jgi:hypothetical protein
MMHSNVQGLKVRCVKYESTLRLRSGKSWFFGADLLGFYKPDRSYELEKLRHNGVSTVSGFPECR